MSILWTDKNFANRTIVQNIERLDKRHLHKQRLEPPLMPCLLIALWMSSLLIIGGLIGWIVSIVFLGVKR